MNRRFRLELGFLLGTTALITGRLTGSKTAARALGAAALATALWPTRPWSLKDRVAVITGGSRGLGLALAKRILGSGGKVALLARDAEELDSARAFLESNHQVPRGCVFTVTCDVTDPAQVDRALAETRARFGGIDLLINNAGAIAVGPLESLEQKDFDAQMAVHFRGPLNTTLAVRPYFHMREGGRIINISSIGGRIAMPHLAAYCTSKFALGGLSETLRAELKNEGITVTTVYPGFMRTGSPVQAVFKGDHAREFAWFALGDSAPGISMSADTAARRILDGCCQGRAEMMVSVPARAATLVRALFPELFAWGTELAARLLPSGRSREAWTGARSLKALERLGEGILGRFWGRRMGRYVSRVSHQNAGRWNERFKYDADFNLGVSPTS